MLYMYPAIFHKEEGSYWVEFPDLPGCQTFGDTLAETMEGAQEALAAYLVTLLSDGTPIPAPSPIQEIKTNDASAFTSLVSCTLSGNSESKSVKKTLTIPAWLNDLASMKGINFSKTLQEALIQKVHS